MKASGFSSITNQLKYGLALIAGLSALLTGGLLIYLSFQAQVQHLEAIQHERSRVAAGEIDAYIDDLQRKLGYLARVRGLTTFPPDIQTNLLEGLTRHNTAYETIAILDNTGRVVTAISPYGPLTLKDQAGAPPFSHAFEQQEDFFGPVEFDPATRLPVITLAVPIRNRQDEVDGVLLAKVNLEYLWFVVSQAAVGETGYAYIIDERNFLVAQKGDSPETFTLEDLSDRPFIDDLTSGAVDPPVAYRGLRGVDVLGAMAPIESIHWNVVIELPVAEAYAPVRRLLVAAGFTLIVAAIISIGVGVILSNRIVSPLQRLTKAAAQISGGNLAIEVDVNSRNELGILAAAFNEMAARLRELIDKLEQRVAALKQAERKLARSKAEFEAIFNAIPDAVVFADTSRHIVMINPAVQTLFDYTHEELYGRTTEILYADPADYNKQGQRRYHVGAKGENKPYKVSYRRKDSMVFMSETLGTRVKDTDGTTIGFIGIIRDITERVQAEEALQKSEGRYRLLAENVTDVIWTMDMNLRSTYTSPSVKHLRGYTAEEAMAQTLEETLTPASLEVAVKAFEEELVIEKMPQRDLFRTRTLEFENTRKDGSTVWTEVKMTFLRDPDGRPIGILGVSRDITERKQAEQALRESEEKFRKFANTSNDMIHLNDSEGRIIYANPITEKLLGYPVQDIINRPAAELIHPDDREKIRQNMGSALKGKTVGATAIRLIRKDGNYLQVEVSGFSIELKNQQIYIGAILRDITERVRAEEELRKHRDHLEELVKKRTAELRRLVNAMAGREMRMTELKGVIRQLRAQLQEAGLTPVADDPLAPWRETESEA